jgi:arylsulfatase A-like enzyme
VIFLWIAGLVACRHGEQAPCAGCDVVWITVDSLRADRVDVYGATSNLTPSVDALARRGTTFRTAIAQGPHTLVSVPTFFSSRYLHQTGMTFDLAPRQQYRRLSENVTTIAEVLEAAKYETVGYVDSPLLAGPAARYGIEQGFHTWTRASDAEMTRAGIERLDAQRTDASPLFLYLQYEGPEPDNREGPGFEAKHGTFDTPIRSPRGATADLYMKIREGGEAVDAAGWEWIRALYDDAVQDTDALVGQVLDAVSRRARPTLVIFTSDHGESLGEVRDKPYLGHNQALWDEAVRVPLVIAGPGVDENEVVSDGLAELIDVAPTITTLLGIPVEPAWKWVGQPLLGPGGGPGAYAISTSRSSTDVHGIIRDLHAKVLSGRVAQDAERFDLDADPLEQSPTSVDMGVDPLGQILHESWASSRIIEAQMFASEEDQDEQIEALGEAPTSDPSGEPTPQN